MTAKTQLIPGVRSGRRYGSFSKTPSGTHASGQVTTPSPLALPSRLYASFTHITASDNPTLGYLNLFTQGSIYPYGAVNLSLVGVNKSVGGYLNLVAYNNGTVGTLNLTTFGDGITAGAVPINGSLNLYIECPIGATLGLYMLGGPQPTGTGSMNMYTFGVYNITGSMNLAIPNTKDNKVSGMHLYTHGF
jgi:hypothetical protein